MRVTYYPSMLSIRLPLHQRTSFSPNRYPRLRVHSMIETIRFITNGFKRTKCHWSIIVFYQLIFRKLRNGGRTEQLRSGHPAGKVPDREEGNRSSHQSYKIGILSIHGFHAKRHSYFKLHSVAVLPFFQVRCKAKKVPGITVVSMRSPLIGNTCFCV